MKTEGYQRFLVTGFKPFNPLELARETERIVTRDGQEGMERKYTGFQSRPVYGGIASGYAVGCCLRCVYCWSDWSRDLPDKLGKFYSPRDVAQKLYKAAKEGIPEPHWRKRIPQIGKLRLSGCEPTLGKEHLLSVLEHLEESRYSFYLETNGILFGADRDYVKKLSRFLNFIYVRVSFKAATPEGLTQRTGAIGEYYELPFKALRYLLDEGIYTRAAAMTDSKIMPEEEKKMLIEKLEEIDPKANYSKTLEEETIDTYDTTMKRLRGFTDVNYAKKLEEELLRYG
ncbi:MAG: radical SAM protein [Candidatus Methylarchaceae archaeon HK01M]|nr:radical SAM protein [Candidatus Methylarchaceae archaeon HK01M]